PGPAQQGDRRRERLRARGRHPPGRDAEGQVDLPDHGSRGAGPRDDAAARQALGPPRLLPRVRRGGHAALRRRARRRLRPLQAARRHPQDRDLVRRLRPGGFPRMSRRRRYLVACLAGHGIGPEVMAEASRALAEVSRLHGFAIDEAHLPFGGEAVTRWGHALPAATRAAYSGADAILVASSSQPALEGVKAGLDLAASVTRMRLGPRGDLTVFAPLADGAEDWTTERAFAVVCERNGRLASVARSDSWRARVQLT